jgi:hypothetical protein
MTSKFFLINPPPHKIHWQFQTANSTIGNQTGNPIEAPADSIFSGHSFGADDFDNYDPG